MIKDKNKSTAFIDFLNNEFQSQKSKPVVAKVLPKQTIKKIEKALAKKVETSKKSVVKKAENVFGKKSNVKNRLANASKLIKTMEVFLDGKNTEMQVDYVTFEGWDEIYKNMKVNIHKDVEDLIRKKTHNKKRKTFSILIKEKLEYVPQGNVLNYSVMVMSVLMISFFSTAIFPNFTNKSISKIDSMFEYPINKIVKMQNIVDETEGIMTAKKTEVVTKEQLAEYIKKNFDKIRNNQTVPVEDITGQVAGVEE
ncbi:hypothetical protein L6270_04115 [Candidatus Parcubacteria bacterium]|nr:hypothetical protein [Patescibacteria group bacterium]MBU4309149.1 hypothetical protein [Patescibacteria group bacterium]MBU4432158.1 hypothetical protein [Patescibacteria group bacterium]MBU4577510.1 hypothetical protein [Patescibacteria group bacterium]MCG2697197.1 hypothetical protein [Candidatus Parcubacteria bacterium]